MAKISNIKLTVKDVHVFAFDYVKDGYKQRFEEKLIKLDGKYKVLLSRENTWAQNEALLELEAMINAGQYEWFDDPEPDTK